jgi:hypothetical protein
MLKKHICFCLSVFFSIMHDFSDCDGSAVFRISLEKTQIAPILINIGLNLTFFGPVQSFDLLILKKERWGSHVLRVLSKITKRWGSHVLRVLSKIEFCALAPGLFYN